VPLQKIRARNEAQVLTEAFGEEYLRYRSKTWF
jgi:protein-S-isoprenylcysteine O-methyltransferase Ste14